MRKSVEVITLPYQICRYTHLLNGLDSKLDERKTLCTYRIVEGGAQVCGRDVGSALVRNKTLTGLLTWTDCNGKTPPVYLRVSEYTKWIQKAIRQ